MNISPKLRIIVLIVIFSLLFIYGVVGFVLLSREHHKTQALEQKIEELSKDKKIIEEDFEATKQSLAKLNKSLGDSEHKIRLLSNQVDNESKSNEALQSQLDTLNLQLKTQKDTKEQLERRISRLQGDLENFLTRFKELEEESVGLQTKLHQYETQVELGTIVVEPEDEESNSAVEKETEITALSGSVIKVNSEYEFLVIDIGQDESVAEGEVFSVYHAGRYIGDVQIASVHPTLSAANFLPNLKKKLVRESDAVVKKD